MSFSFLKTGNCSCISRPSGCCCCSLFLEKYRLEETVQTLVPLRHQQSALIQSYEVRMMMMMIRKKNREKALVVVVVVVIPLSKVEMGSGHDVVASEIPPQSMGGVH